MARLGARTPSPLGCLTAMVKSLFYPHAVPPKDLRASYITHMRSGQLGDECSACHAAPTPRRRARQLTISLPLAYHKRNALAQSAVAEAERLSGQFVHG